MPKLGVSLVAAEAYLFKHQFLSYVLYVDNIRFCRNPYLFFFVYISHLSTTQKFYFTPTLTLNLSWYETHINVWI
jgi:hypothetical protein